MVEASTQLIEKESQPIQESILPRVNESYNDWRGRVDVLLREFRAREGKT